MTSKGSQDSPPPSTAHSDNYHDADAHPHQSQSGSNGSGGLLPPAAMPPDPPSSVAVAIKAISDHHRTPASHEHASQNSDMFNSPYSMSHPSTAPGSPRM